MQPWRWWRFRPDRRGRPRQPGWEFPVTVAMRLTGNDSAAGAGRRGSGVGRQSYAWSASGHTKKDRGKMLLVTRRF